MWVENAVTIGLLHSKLGTSLSIYAPIACLVIIPCDFSPGLWLSAGPAERNQVLLPRQHHRRQPWGSNRPDGYHVWSCGRRAAHGLWRGGRGAPHPRRKDSALRVYPRVRSPHPQTPKYLHLHWRWDRDSIGGSSVVGDRRWAGTFGVEADFVARTHCSVEIIRTDAIKARTDPRIFFLALPHSPFLACNSFFA